MSLGAWLELLTSGLITGGIYALVALGLNLCGLMRILNIAHGEFLMVGLPHVDVQTSLGISPLLMVPVSFLVLMALTSRSTAVLPPAHRHFAQPGHLRGARADGGLRTDVPGAELRVVDVGRRPARLRLPDRAGEVRRRAVRGQQAAGVRAGAGLRAA